MVVSGILLSSVHMEMSIKFTNDPPQGIRASLKRTFSALSQDVLDYSSASQWQPILFALAFLHTVVQERRKYGPLGWNIPYEFNQSDFAASLLFLQKHLDDMDPKQAVCWRTVSYMLGEVMYGGRVTDDFDKRLLLTYTDEWFTEKLVQTEFEFYSGYGRPPDCNTIQKYLEYVNSLPRLDSPEVFGLHENADITYQINTAVDILRDILAVQPKDNTDRGGDTRETVILKMAGDMLAKLPSDYLDHEIRSRLVDIGPEPMNIFLRQELNRFQAVLNLVRSTLQDLQLAIEGTIIMSDSLRNALDSMYDARIPSTWKKISWESSTLGFWFTELLERDAQYRTWFNEGRPNVFWMAGFFNPQGFLTAMRQEVTRAHKGWALDTAVQHNQVTKLNKEDVTVPPAEGVYVCGLYLDGASWDRRSCQLRPARQKVLYEPCIVQ